MVLEKSVASKVNIIQQLIYLTNTTDVGFINYMMRIGYSISKISLNEETEIS